MFSFFFTHFIFICEIISVFLSLLSYFSMSFESLKAEFLPFPRLSCDLLPLIRFNKISFLITRQLQIMTSLKDMSIFATTITSNAIVKILSIEHHSVFQLAVSLLKREKNQVILKQVPSSKTIEFPQNICSLHSQVYWI